MINWHWIKLTALLLDVIAAIILSGVVFNFRAAIAKEREINDTVLRAIHHDNKLVTLAVVLIVISFLMVICCEMTSHSSKSMMIKSVIGEEFTEIARRLRGIPQSDWVATLQQMYRQ